MKFSLGNCFHLWFLGLPLAGAFLLSGCSNAPPIKIIAAPSYVELMASADEAQKKGEMAESVDYFGQATRSDPSKKQPWLRIAQIQFDAKNYGAAISSAQEVLQRDTADVTAKSIMAVSGLRVSANALELLRQVNAVNGNTREEAQTLAKTMRDALGESILPTTNPLGDSGPKPVVRSTNKNRAVVPVNPSTGVVPPAGSAKPTPVPETKRNPFEALKG